MLNIRLNNEELKIILEAFEECNVELDLEEKKLYKKIKRFLEK
jgi:hypothetical protein